MPICLPSPPSPLFLSISHTLIHRKPWLREMWGNYLSVLNQIKREWECRWAMRHWSYFWNRSEQQQWDVIILVVLQATYSLFIQCETWGGVRQRPLKFPHRLAENMTIKAAAEQRPRLRDVTHMFLAAPGCFRIALILMRSMFNTKTSMLTWRYLLIIVLINIMKHPPFA